MKYIIHEDHIALSDSDREHLNRKLSGLEKHLVSPFQITVRVRHDTHHRKGEVVFCSIEISVSGSAHPVYAERSAETFLTACDQAVHALQRELNKAHDKHKEHRP